MGGRQHSRTKPRDGNKRKRDVLEGFPNTQSATNLMNGRVASDQTAGIFINGPTGSRVAIPSFNALEKRKRTLEIRDREYKIRSNRPWHMRFLH